MLGGISNFPANTSINLISWFELVLVYQGLVCKLMYEHVQYD